MIPHVAPRRRRGVLHKRTPETYSATGSRSYLSVVVCVLLATRLGAEDAQQRIPVLPQDNLPAEIDLDAAKSILHSRGYDVGKNVLTQPQVELGRQLFFDPILSKDNTVSCASCHQPEHGFAAPHAKAIGIGGQIGRRNAPTVLNRAFGKQQFWDGRAATLEEQSLQPIENPTELGHSIDAVIAELRKQTKYVERFNAAFRQLSKTEQTVTRENIAKSLASFQRTLLTPDSSVDRFQAGDYRALSDDERQGLWIFESRGHCWKCHSGDNYTDESFHNIGVADHDPSRDRGRFEVTKVATDKGRFKTPTLRAVALTAPYMHNGSLKSLKDVVEFYNRGGDSESPLLDQRIKPLGLSDQEVIQLVAFLNALSRS